MANSVDPDQTTPIGAVCSESALFASILTSSVMVGNNLQQTTSADYFFRCIFFALKGLKCLSTSGSNKQSCQAQNQEYAKAKPLHLSSEKKGKISIKGDGQSPTLS